MPNINDLLGTKDRKLQAQRVAQLIRDATAPVIDLIIRFDPRADDVTLQWVGIDRLPIEFLKKMIEQARQIIEEKEIRAKLQQEQAAQIPLPLPETPPADAGPAELGGS
jgi:hypothetical protein